MSYTYGQLHASCGANAFAGPHALTQIAGIKNSTYCYDRNGNMVSGDGRSVQYTAYDMPTRIEKGGNTVSFFYGPDRKRYKRIDATVTDGTSTTVYVADKAYERITKGTNSDEKVYIGDFAVMTRTVVSGGAGSLKTEYLHRDHLESVDTITDETGAVVQRMSFDAFGKRRETNWAAMTNEAVAAFDTSRTKRGFTGHEMIDPVGLVHMNGRVYEPEVGRFLSADPVVEDIDNLQTYNRYSYVRNNPLTLTDPSGFNAAASSDAASNSVGDSEESASVTGHTFAVDLPAEAKQSFSMQSTQNQVQSPAMAQDQSEKARSAQTHGMRSAQEAQQQTKVASLTVGVIDQQKHAIVAEPPAKKAFGEKETKVACEAVCAATIVGVAEFAYTSWRTYEALTTLDALLFGVEVIQLTQKMNPPQDKGKDKAQTQAQDKAQDKTQTKEQTKAEDKARDEEQAAKDAKRMSDKELSQAAKKNGYKDAHDLKRDYQLDRKSDIFVDKQGNLYAGPTKGRQGSMEPLGISKYGD